MASVTEVGSNIDRINLEIAGKPVTLSLFAIKDEEPTLIETSYRRVLDEVIDTVPTVTDPSIAGPSAMIPVDEAPIGARVGLMFVTTETAGR